MSALGQKQTCEAPCLLWAKQTIPPTNGPSRLAGRQHRLILVWETRKQPKMFIKLPKRARIRVALVVAAVYAMCVVSPALAIAFTDGTVAAHCFTDEHHEMSAQHVHGDVHSHDKGPMGTSNDHEKQKSEDCCGLFCITVGAVPLSVELTQPDRGNAVTVVFDDAPGGRPGDRIDRPPRSLLSM
jgi:hypothetical protein